MLVKQWMTRDVVTISPEESLFDIRKKMDDHHFRRLPVVDNRLLVGIVSDRDIRTARTTFKNRHKLSREPESDAGIKARDIMSKPVITISSLDTIEAAALKMHNNNIGGLPVLDKGELAGIITEHDIFEALIEVTGAKWGVPRLTLVIEDRPGSVKEIADVIRKYPAKILSFLITKYQMPADKRQLILRVDSEKLDKIIEDLEQHFGEVVVHQQ